VTTRILRFVGRGLLGLILVALTFGLSYRWYVQRQISEDRAIRSSRGIDRLEAVRIGGIDQWIHVRGEDTNNPLLLFIHGGPGIGFIAMARTFQRPWEKYFTVVQWDQRGAGKTYAANDRELQRRTMTVSRMEQDALELVNYLRTRFRRNKIIVMGVSWGSVLGLWLAHEHPDAIDAYVGVGQAVNMNVNSRTAYEDALHEARRRNLVEAVSELESIGPYPPPAVDLRKGEIAQHWQAELLGPPEPVRFLKTKRILFTLLSAPEYSLRDVYGFTRGQFLSLEVLVPQVSTLDMTTLGEFRVLMFFFQGRLDPYTRPRLIQQYANTITAPRRDIVWFENAGHFPFFEDQRTFTDELARRVRPLAIR
jgi:pimeloyl-ACP methyl ester carboxylesterase